MSKEPGALHGDICKNLPPVTFLVGEYGDTVACRDSAFVSWYPAGLLSQETRLSPARNDIIVSPQQKREIISATLGGLQQMMPGAVDALAGAPTEWDVVGGYISAWEDTGISDRQSELHNRHDIGVHSYRGYHSVDTGKYTLAPMLAAEVAARITNETQRLT